MKLPINLAGRRCARLTVELIRIVGRASGRRKTYDEINAYAALNFSERRLVLDRLVTCERRFDSFGGLCSNAVRHFQPVTFSELSQVVERGNLELLVQHGGRLGAHSRKFQQVQNRGRSLGGQSLPGVEGASLYQLNYLSGQSFADSGNLEQPRQALLAVNLSHF